MTSIPTIALDNFKGPVDLLLYLIQKSEIDIYDIRIQQILKQFLESFPQQEEARMESGSEFLSTAATLLLLKSQKLLPASSSQEKEEETDPRFTTLKRLLEYCRFKELSAFLSQKEEGSLSAFPRGAPPLPIPDRSLGIEHLSLDAFAEAMELILQRAPRVRDLHLKEEWKVAERIVFLSRLLQERDEISFSELFSEGKCQAELIATFLAVLELLKIGSLKIIEDMGTISFAPKSEA